MMIVIGIAAKAATAVIATIVTMNSCRNMIQTYQFASYQSKRQCNNNNNSAKIPSIQLSRESIVDDIQKLNRLQILKLYFEQCRVPESLDEIDGEWNGILLQNNGLVCTTGFFLHSRFMFCSCVLDAIISFVCFFSCVFVCFVILQPTHSVIIYSSTLSSFLWGGRCYGIIFNKSLFQFSMLVQTFFVSALFFCRRLLQVLSLMSYSGWGDDGMVRNLM